jgi:Fur family ferric uptake transcriptional regulator
VIGQRVTRQRIAISGLLDGLDEFRSAQQIHHLLQDRGDDIGLATVYRTLGAMATAGEVDVMRTEGGESLYLRCAPTPYPHHHHLVCRRCGRTVEVAGPSVEAVVEALAADHGFVDVEHTLEFYGTCASCAAAGTP